MTKPIGYYCNHFTDLERRFGSHLEAFSRAERLQLLHLLATWLYAESEDPINWSLQDIQLSWNAHTTENVEQAVALLDSNQEANEDDVLGLIIAIASQVREEG